MDFSRWRAFIFDLDGTLVDNMGIHLIAWHQTLAEIGFDLPLQQVEAEMYGKNQEVLRRLLGPEANQMDLDSLSLRKERLYRRAYQGNVAALPGLSALLQAAHTKGIRMAIGSAAPMANIELVLNELGWQTLFSAIVSADETTHGKPHPEVFLTAASRLGIAPADCLVFEDSPKGAEAANRGGMACAVLTSTHTEPAFAHLPNVVAIAADYTGWGLA